MINDKRLNVGQWFLRGSVSFKWHLSGLIPRVPCGALTTIPPPPTFGLRRKGRTAQSLDYTLPKREAKSAKQACPVTLSLYMCYTPYFRLAFFFSPQGLVVFPFFFFFFFFFFLRNEYYKNRIQLAQPTLSSIMKWRDICTYAYWRFQHLVNSWP